MRRLIVDVSSVCWMGLLAGKDEEFGRTVRFEEKDVQVNSAAFGYDNAMSHLLSVMNHWNAVPQDVILVFEGRESKKLRQGILPQYKATRSSRPPEAYDEFNKLTEMLFGAFISLGASAARQDYVEGDDIIAYLAQNLEGERIIVTGDGDLAQLVDAKSGIHLWRRDKLDENPYGPFQHRHINLYKALVGDSSDNIPGAKGFGPKAWLDLLVLFGDEGLDAMEDLIKLNQLHTLVEDVGEMKALQKIIDNAETVKQSYLAAKLYPERINTLRRPLTWSAGMVRPIREIEDERLRKWGGQTRLITADNYDGALQFFKEELLNSPRVAFDIETATPEESDEWLETAKGKSDDGSIGVDVFGSELVSFSVTFGANNQYTFYVAYQHSEQDGKPNVTREQARDFIVAIPPEKELVIQNVSFELTVCYNEFGADWKDNGWHGFLPNAVDTKIMASYVNENVSSGLKQGSDLYLGYKQVSYAEVTTKTGPKGTLPPWGKVSYETNKETGEITETRRYKMHELTASEVQAYGSDDTICTIALYNHFRKVMEIEKTWSVYQQVEVKPAYLTALAFCQGTPISLARMKELEREDDKAYAAAWQTLRDYLIEKGWEGTKCPVFTELTAPTIKEIYFLITGEELKTQVRTPAKIIKLPEFDVSDDARVLAGLLARGDLDRINGWISTVFDGEPKLDINSPKQMKALLYDVMGIPVRIVNKVTDNERETKKDLADALYKFKRIQNGSKDTVMTPEELELIKAKAKTDDTAIDFALAFDASVVPVPVLEAFKKMKMVSTRRSLFYKPYQHVRHWKDNLVHAHTNQCAAVTRRYSSSGPNLTQLPKKGEGVKFREVFVPHHKDAVIVSIDEAGQELRLMAGQSQDANMMACYVGAKKKDIHSITASGAMKKKWGAELVERLFQEQGQDLVGTPDAMYDLFVRIHKSGKASSLGKKADDLRKDAKNVNFAAQFDAQALKLSEMLVITLEDAQTFLDAKYAMFPRVETWKDEVRAAMQNTGYATTMLGARRHFEHVYRADNKWEIEAAGRQGPNFKIQGSAAEQIKLAMGRVWDSGILFKYDMRFISPIHDELVFSVHRDHALPTIQVVHAAMSEPYGNLPVPFFGSISLGPNFGEQIECGEVFDATAIQGALDKVFDIRLAA
jgi:DNA polymerase I-like protein with 3'-5' exonuclease and polymerase domains/5'-3' exonuclease